MKMNKNIFALALFFATFTTQAHNATYNAHDKTITITVDHHNATKTIVAIVVTPEEAMKLMHVADTDNDAMRTPAHGTMFQHDNITYVVKKDGMKQLNLTINITINIDNIVEEEIIVIDAIVDDSDFDDSDSLCSDDFSTSDYSDSNDTVINDLSNSNNASAPTTTTNDVVNSNEDTAPADDIDSDDTTPQL